MSPLADPPESSGALAAFPFATLAPETPIARIHRRDRSPLWFAHDGSGRFDLWPPRGTLYGAEEPLGSLFETFKDLRLLNRAEVEARHLSHLACARPLRLADGTSRRARVFGVTAEIHGTPDYGKTQRWAAKLAEAGFDGIRYLVSHDPAQRLVGYALFGDAGEAAAASAWSVLETRSVPEGLLVTLFDELGLPVLPPLLGPGGD